MIKKVITITLIFALLLIGFHFLKIKEEKYSNSDSSVNVTIDEIESQLKVLDPLGRFEFLYLSPILITYLYHNLDFLHYSPQLLVELLSSINDFYHVKYLLFNIDTLRLNVKDQQYQMARRVYYPRILNNLNSFKNVIPLNLIPLRKKFEKSLQKIHSYLRKELDAMKKYNPNAKTYIYWDNEELANPILKNDDVNWLESYSY